MPFTGYYKVPADLTVDMSVAYDLPSDLPYLSGTQVYVSGHNIFNEAPPPYNIAAGYDSSDASPLGRLVLFGLERSGEVRHRRPVPAARLNIFPEN